MAEISPGFVQTRDLRMHYLQAGTGEPVILIHGFPETSHEWMHQLAVLGDEYAVFAPDTRGMGQTDKPGIRVSRHLLAQDIINFMDAMGIERAAVVGHDWGGIIAFKVAIDWPERVTRLALLDTLCTTWAIYGVHGYWYKAKPYPEELFARYNQQYIESSFTGVSIPELPGRPFSTSVPRPGMKRWISDEGLAHYKAAFADPMSQWHAIQYYRYALPFHEVVADESAPNGERYVALDELEVAEMWNHPGGIEQHPGWKGNYMDFGPEDRHKRFLAPTLYAYSAQLSGPKGALRPVDEIPRGNPFVDQYTRYFPDLRARRMEAGHFFPEETPEVTTAMLRDFLAGRI